MEVLGINHAAGISRISPAEAAAAGTPPEWATRWNAWATKAAQGKLTPELAKQGQQLMDVVVDAAHQRAVQSSQLIAKGHGIDPAQMPAMDCQGNLTTLDQAAKPQQKNSAARHGDNESAEWSDQTSPSRPGRTLQINGSDGGESVMPQQQGQAQSAPQQDWFSQNAPPTASQGQDWFSSNAPTQQAAPPDQATVNLPRYGQVTQNWNPQAVSSDLKTMGAIGGSLVAPELIAPEAGLLVRSLLSGAGAGVGTSVGQAIGGQNPFTKDSATEAAINASLFGVTDFAAGAVPAIAKSKLGRSFINESMQATGRDVIYGNPAKALLERRYYHANEWRH